MRAPSTRIVTEDIEGKAVIVHTNDLNAAASAKLPPRRPETSLDISTSTVEPLIVTASTRVPGGKRTASVPAGGPAIACVAA